MTPEEERLLLEERDLLRQEVSTLTEQVRLVVRAEHALTRSRRLVDRQLQRIRRLAEFALTIAGSEAPPEILEHARRTLLECFELDDVVIVTSDPSAASSLAVSCGNAPAVAAPDAPGATRLLELLRERGAGPLLGASPRVVVWVPLRSRASEVVAVLVAWSSRVNAHHRDLPRAEHLPFLELFGSHVTRALDNAALTLELRSKNQQLSTSLADLERTQAQLVQAQKLEALGRLAGGIAHDFNNLLTLIVGAADALRPVLDGKVPENDELETIAGATKRATAITRRLLAFGRQQERKLEPVDLNALATDLSRMLRHLINDSVTLKLDLDAHVAPVCADPVQIEQIIMNLVINARDAMPDGGTVTIETRNASNDVGAGAEPGAEMVALRVVDTGTGIDESIRAQLFEPFFTTKPVGKGTGLGLSTVYGLVNQNQGQISVQSRPGEGAAFTVFLPIARAACQAETAPSGDAPRGTILIVEDEDGIRRMAARMLRRAGYDVHEARDGLDALALERGLSRLDLIVTDVVMPNLSGPELVRQLRELRPELPVVYMSGYTFDNLETGTLDPEVDGFLSKPFGAESLKTAVERMLQKATIRLQPAAG